MPAGAKNARRVAWIVAACLLVGTIVAVVGNNGGDEPPVERDESPPALAEEDTGAETGPSVPPEGGPADEPPAAAVAPVADRLKELWSDVDSYRDEHGHFPPGQVDGEMLAEPERFSWLAALWVQSGRAPAVPLWNEGWRAPLNRPFSQSDFPAVVNPLANGPRDAGGYPVTHFAGVAGVGDDAASLPKQHPRAGVFGDRRQTRLEDIRDGQANTMLIAGVAKDSGPWSAAGRSTVRPLTQEPYVNGPDGFGTGQPDSMLVLMADGSVRTITRQTSPIVVRRMAAMADGLPLDPNVKGEPGESEPELPQLAEQPKEEPAPMPEQPDDARPRAEEPADPRAEDPILVELAPDEPTYDVEGALGRTIIEFEQPTPVPFIALLRQLQELAGVPFLLDEPVAEERLQQEVTLSAANASLGDILALLLAEIDLRFEARLDGVHIREAGDAAAELTD
ncbi:hypothetical protein [Maioricimonas rarisocia]|nr:hypothetical protein [Maioricimonas rarisocia]